MLHPLYPETVEFAHPKHPLYTEIAEIAEIAVHIVDRRVLLKHAVKRIEPNVNVVGNLAPALEPCCVVFVVAHVEGRSAVALRAVKNVVRAVHIGAESYVNKLVRLSFERCRI